MPGAQLRTPTCAPGSLWLCPGEDQYVSEPPPTSGRRPPGRRIDPSFLPPAPAQPSRAGGCALPACRQGSQGRRLFVGHLALGSRVPRTAPQGAPPAPLLAARGQHRLRPLRSALQPALSCLFPSSGRPLTWPRPGPNPPTSPGAGFGRLRPAAWPQPAVGCDPSVPCSACFLDLRPNVACFASACPV